MLTTLTILGSIWIAVVLASWWLVVPWLRRGPGRCSAVTGLLWHVDRLYTRKVHQARFEGQEELRSKIDAGPLIVLSNHTGAVDPLLIQAACDFHIRWMMASNMMSRSLDWLWRQQEMIPVARDGSDSGPLREAIRHVRGGGIIGIFPEGRIVTPPRQVWPFMRGVGLLVAKTKAPVLVAWISETPNTNDFVTSLTTPSNAIVRFLDVIDFADERDPDRIVQTLRDCIAGGSGWPLADEAPPPPSADMDPFA